MTKLIRSLKSLSEVILKLRVKANENGITLDKELVTKWKIKDFNSSNNGVTYTEAVGVEVYEDNWVRIRSYILTNLHELNVQKICVDLVSSNFPSYQYPDFAVNDFINHILFNCLFIQIEGEYSDCIDKVIELFIKNLNGEPVECTAQVFIEGLVIESEYIQLTPEITLRRTRKTELETAMSLRLLKNQMLNVSVILEIKLKLLLAEASNMQTKILQYVTIFRLFGVGTIRYILYFTNSEAIIQRGFPRGYTYAGETIYTDRKYKIENSMEVKLRDFCREMEIILPDDFYKLIDKKINYLTIAYDRYSEAVLEPVFLERKITNVVMGLEALYSNSDTELSFKLNLRISKLLSFLSKDPLVTRSFIKEAYKIRSTFAHGSQLTPKEQNKLNNFGGFEIFLYTMIDYLRILILATLKSGISKEQLIELSDDSFLVPQKEDELKYLLSTVLPFT